MASENKVHILCKMSGVCLYIWAKFKIPVVFVLTVVKDVRKSDLRVICSVKNCYWLHLYCLFYCCTYLASKVHFFFCTVHCQTEKMMIMQSLCFITVVYLDVREVIYICHTHCSSQMHCNHCHSVMSFMTLEWWKIIKTSAMIYAFYLNCVMFSFAVQ